MEKNHFSDKKNIIYVYANTHKYVLTITFQNSYFCPLFAMRVVTDYLMKGCIGIKCFFFPVCCLSRHRSYLVQSLGLCVCVCVCVCVDMMINDDTQYEFFYEFDTQ